MNKITITKFSYQGYTVTDKSGSVSFTGKTARSKAMTLFKKLSIKSEENND
jgi:hypothetical protein|tara:strand:- start:261 stop:413 length:153 start_codon:yes stop_codon:yes gene_type:complete